MVKQAKQAFKVAMQPSELKNHNKSFCAKALPIPNSNVAGDKSFADDLNKERGIVSCRVALLLRSSEIKPLF